MTISIELVAPVSPYTLNDNLLIYEYRYKAICYANLREEYTREFEWSTFVFS